MPRGIVRARAKLIQLDARMCQAIEPIEKSRGQIEPAAFHGAGDLCCHVLIDL